MKETAVGGYEYGALCPKCGHFTEIGCHLNPAEFVCGEKPYISQDDDGCGRTLRVIVEVVEDGDSR